MENANPKTNIHLIYGVLLTIVAVVALLALVVLRSQTDDTTGSVTITNQAPVIDDVIVAIVSYGTQSDLTLAENTTITYYVHGTATDANSCLDISEASGVWTGQVYRTSVGNAAADDNNDHYSLAEDAEGTNFVVDNCTGQTDTSNRYQWTTTMHYWADSTDVGGEYAEDWTARVTLADVDGGQAAAVTQVFEVNELVAINVDGTEDYGTLALGADSASQQLTITNTGNSATVDANVSGLATWTCTDGTFVVGQVHYSLAAITDWTVETALTATATLFDRSVAHRTVEGTPSTGVWHSMLRMPADGIAGACTTTFTFTALE